ncbi:MAG: hypothetical protein JWL63_2726 [Rhodocyclales bacterium]|nr:hypothetical protein [Rhodocyclales bacterium]
MHLMTHTLWKMTCLAGAVCLSIATAHAADENVVQPKSVESLALAVQLPSDNKVNFRGIVSLDDVSAAHGGVLYGPGPALGLVGLLVHGLVVNSVKESQKSSLQKAADEVLVRYQATLDTLQLTALMQQGLQRMKTTGSKTLIATGARANHAWLIESTPVFSMTQDQKAIVLDNAIAIHAPDSQDTVAYQNIIRIVATPRNGDDIATGWLANNGEKLKEESASLFAESLDIALTDIRKAAGSAAAPQKTVRYPEGGIEKMERGELVSEFCNRVVIKTLRGWLMSVPSLAGSSNGQCEVAAPQTTPVIAPSPTITATPNAL